MSWQTKSVEVSALSSLSGRFYVPVKFVFISLSLVNQKVITRSSNPFTRPVFIAVIYLRPALHTVPADLRQAAVSICGVTLVIFINLWKDEPGFDRSRMRIDGTISHSSYMFKTRNRDVMDVLSRKTHRWTSTVAGRWERSIISSRWRSAKRTRPTSRENTPHGWGGAENISTHLRGLSRRARFLISVADRPLRSRRHPSCSGTLAVRCSIPTLKTSAGILSSAKTCQTHKRRSSACFERMIVPLSKVTSISDLDSLCNEAQKESSQDRKPRAAKNTIRLFWRVESEEIEKRKWSSLQVKYIRYFLWPRFYGYNRHLV